MPKLAALTCGLLMFFCTGLLLAQPPGANEMPSVIQVPAAAQATTNFDATAATNGYLAQIPADKTARSDAYFEGGYWMILWDFLYGVVVALLLLNLRWSARMRDSGRAHHALQTCPNFPVLVAVHHSHKHSGVPALGLRRLFSRTQIWTRHPDLRSMDDRPVEVLGRLCGAGRDDHDAPVRSGPAAVANLVDLGSDRHVGLPYFCRNDRTRLSRPDFQQSNSLARAENCRPNLEHGSRQRHSCQKCL